MGWTVSLYATQHSFGCTHIDHWLSEPPTFGWNPNIVGRNMKILTLTILVIRYHIDLSC